MKASHWLPIVMTAAGVGCTVGDGAGHASGPLFVLDCDGGANRGTPESPVEFDLSPRFFAGEPINDVRQGGTTNRLIIRLQRVGGSIEIGDTLFFDIANAREVARCVRGRVVRAPNGTLVPDYDTDLCFRAEGKPPRVRLNPYGLVTSSLAPAATCETTEGHAAGGRNVVGTAVSCRGPDGCPPDGQFESFIDIESFGSAKDTNPSAEARRPIPEGFKVEFGERIHVSFFRVTLEDAAVVEAARENRPTPPPAIGGVLEGYFDFDLARGRAGQTFP
jgi:hypothetical protein